VALSGLAREEGVIEAEINPLLILERGQGVVAVDALARIARSETTAFARYDCLAMKRIVLQRQLF
jgi:succinyl-CoA synthetase beta subunit